MTLQSRTGSHAVRAGAADACTTEPGRYGPTTPVAPPAAARWALLVILFASIFLQRFAVPGTEIGLNAAVTFAALAWLLIRGQLVLDPLHAAIFCCFASWVWLAAACNSATTSVSSAALLTAMYLPLCASLREPGDAFTFVVGRFQAMVLIGACAGIVQFAAQFVVHSPLLFTFHGMFPRQLLLSGFDNIIPLRWGATLLKSNGFFFVEPSTYSQYLSLAIVLEVLFRRTTRRLLIYVLALPLSYSGTGLILLGLMLPPVLIARRAGKTMALIVAVGALLLLLSPDLHLNVIARRANEFTSTGSSAHARFVGGFWLVSQFQLSSAIHFVLGLGPGSFTGYAKQVPYEAHDASWAKVLFEYGVVGSALFWAYLGVILFRRAPSRWVAAALLIGFMAFGGMLLDPRLHALILVFCVLPKIYADRQAARAAEEVAAPACTIQTANRCFDTSASARNVAPPLPT